MHDRTLAYFPLGCLLVSLVMPIALVSVARASAPSDFDIVAAGGSRSVPGHVEIVLYDLQGRAVAHLASGEFDAGAHTVKLDATGLHSGVYSVRFCAEGRNDVRQLLVVH
jgi:hypothetical protein